MSGTLQSLRVLLVDDNQHMRAIVAAVLQGIGIRHIRECADGAEALRALRDWPADIAIVDFQMAPVDGIDFTRKVRTTENSPSATLPIIMMTGHAERARVIEARDAGVNEFLAKPITAQAVIDRLNTALNRPRPFVRSDTYVGPTRRRRREGGELPQRRAEDRADAKSVDV